MLRICHALVWRGDINMPDSFSFLRMSCIFALLLCQPNDFFSSAVRGAAAAAAAACCVSGYQQQQGLQMSLANLLTSLLIILAACKDPSKKVK
jgi:hypothetical protein